MLLLLEMMLKYVCHLLSFPELTILQFSLLHLCDSMAFSLGLFFQLTVLSTKLSKTFWELSRTLLGKRQKDQWCTLEGHFLLSWHASRHAIVQFLSINTPHKQQIYHFAVGLWLLLLNAVIDVCYRLESPKSSNWTIPAKFRPAVF